MKNKIQLTETELINLIEKMVKEYLENYRKQNEPVERSPRKSFTSMDRPQRKGKGFLRRR